MPQLPILPVCPPVVTEWVVIERAADHLAPMAIIRGDGVADHVRLGLADDPHAARVDDILQDTGTGVVAGEYNIRLRGISGSSAFAFSRPKELKEVISFLYLFISSATVARISSWIGCTSIRVHASTPFPEAGGATMKVCKLEKNHLLHIGTAASGRARRPRW